MGFENTQADPQKVIESIVLDSVKDHFSPEFLNRIDDIVLFDTLTKEQVSEIAQLQLEDLPIEATDSLVSYIVDKGYSAEYGARNISRFIKNNVSDKIADAILNKLVPKKEGEYYTPRICKDGMKIINTEKYNVSSS
jgi:ATP-dependent Clp protease ATP-binding subunit ClpC